MQTAAGIDFGKLSDLELARSIAAGNEGAFEPLMRRYNQMLYRTARSILKDEAEAEDAVQEAYLLAFRAIGEFRGDAKLSTWLVRITVNESIGRLRKRKRTAEVIRLDGEAEPDMATTETSMKESATERPEGAAMRSETRKLLEAKIDSLPDAFRTVFVLRAVEELSVEETAAVLGVPEATVRTRFFRARSLLREALARDIDSSLEEAFSFAGARCDRIVANVLARLKSPSGGA
jgi:RNA polymerase sigma-70 factor (ECF subfamily)